MEFRVSAIEIPDASPVVRVAVYLHLSPARSTIFRV